jgi:uncharacterized membrane protein
MIRSLLLLLVLLAGAGSGIEAQAQGRTGGPAADRGPIDTLIGLRDQIGLTQPQIGRLEEIDARLDRQNQPHVTQMMEIRRRIRALGAREQMTPEQRTIFEGYLSEARPHVQQIARNNAAAMLEVGAVLTQPQKERVAELLKQRGQDRERSGRLPRLPRRGS